MYHITLAHGMYPIVLAQFDDQELFKNRFDLEILATFQLNEFNLEKVLPQDWTKSVFAKRIEIELSDGDSELLEQYNKTRTSGNLMEINDWRSACVMWHLFHGQGAKEALEFFLEYRRTAF